MLSAYLILTQVAARLPAAIIDAKAKAARWAALTPEQKLMELREREVAALEQLARAQENTHR